MAARKTRWKLWTALGVLAVLVAAGAASLAFLLSPMQTFRMGQGLQARNTELTVGACSGSPNGMGTASYRTGLKSTQWDEAGDLNIRYAVATNCAAPFNYGGYQLQGDKLTLEYSIAWKVETTADGKVVVPKTMCTCGYELKYRISGLAKTEYSIDIVEVHKR